jgi:16S rRNA (cytosine967-C5)-methyltransferase
MKDAREIALDALVQITRDKADTQTAIRHAIAEHRLEPREEAFAHTLVDAGLRWGVACDALLATYLTKAIPKRQLRVYWALRLGVVQLLVLGTPAHAAVSTTVDLLKRRKHEKIFANLANAVLKRIADTKPTLDLSQTLSPWLRARWVAAYGAPAIVKMARVATQAPPLDLSMKTRAMADVETLSAMPIGAITLRCARGNPATLPGYAEGTFWVQDVAATLPAQLLGDVAGKEVLDLCAAPGGKTAQLCAAGAKLVALDRAENRLVRLRENMQRLGYAPEIVAADITEWQPGRQFSHILLDAPCSATGTLRRHPEIIWTRTEEDILRHAALQAQLLTRAWQWLAPGGRMVYAVCSLEPEEGEQQIEAFLRATPDAKAVAVALPESAVPPEAITQQGYLRTLPYHWGAQGGMDGFFAAILEKR